MGSHPLHHVETIKRPEKSSGLFIVNGGGSGIRTHGTREGTTVFKTAPINRSGIPPSDVVWICVNLTVKILKCKEIFYTPIYLYIFFTLQGLGNMLYSSRKKQNIWEAL